MTLGQNPFNPSRSLPTLAAIQRPPSRAACPRRYPGRPIQGPNQGPLQPPCEQRANRPGSRTTDNPRPHQ